MSARFSLRRSILLLGALSWIAVPATVYAGPGGGGGHGGGGGGHGGGGHSGGGHGGGHFGGGGHSGGSAHYGGSGYAASGAHGSSPSSGPVAHMSSANSPSRTNNLVSFAAVDDPMFGRGSATVNPNLSQLAGHGWAFLPSAGVAPPTVASRASAARPAMPPRVANIPTPLPNRPRPRPGWGAYPFSPYGFFGGFAPFNGFGGCFFNGFTSVCGASPFLFNSGYCFGTGFWNCGYGYYGGYPGGGFVPEYDTGYVYQPGPDSGNDVNGPPANGAYDSQYYNGPMDLSAVAGNANDNAAQNPSAEAPPAPLAQIILKSGSAYEVTAYWLSNGELYYRPVTGGLSHVPVDQLDLSATVEANSRNGVTFQLTDHSPEH